jgi:hypothetical protein
VSKEIRIPSTTAMFVTNLGQILRQNFSLKVNVHEHWTFEQVAKWEECLQKGACLTHGISDELQAKLDANPGDQSLWWSDCHYPYKIEVYLGEGRLRVSGKAVEIRVRIESIHNDGMGDMYTAQVWVHVEGQKVQKGHFYLENNGKPWVLVEPMPDLPPDKIAFWREPEPTPPRAILAKTGRRPEPTTREKRIARQRQLAEMSR